MNAFWKNVAATVIAAGIVANVTILFQFGERLTRIETKLEALVSNHQIAQTTNEH